MLQSQKWDKVLIRENLQVHNTPFLRKIIKKLITKISVKRKLFNARLPEKIENQDLRGGYSLVAGLVQFVQFVSD